MDEHRPGNPPTLRRLVFPKHDVNEKIERFARVATDDAQLIAIVWMNADGCWETSFGTDEDLSFEHTLLLGAVERLKQAILEDMTE